MDYKVFIFSRNELKIILVGTVVGGILQIICWKYVKNHPELLNSNNSRNVKPKEIQPSKPGVRRFFPRGGAIFEVVGAKLVINLGVAIIYIAKKGTLTALVLTAGGLVVKKIPKNQLSTILRNSLASSYSGLEKHYLLVNDNKKISLEQYDGPLQYMYHVLTDANIPFQYKREMTYKILTQYIDLSTTAGRIRFVLYIVSMIYIFTISDVSGLVILIQNLIDAIKSGRISKKIARLIIRRLKRLNIPIDPELIQVAQG